jgi:hypothetical protein
LIFLLVLVSCKTLKQNESISVDIARDEKSLVENSLDSTKKIVFIDTVFVDTMTHVRELEMMVVENNNLSRQVEREVVEVKKLEKHKNKTGLKIIDKSSNQIDTTRGWVAFSVPETMKVSKTYSVKVRISKRDSGQKKSVLILGDDDAINNSQYPSVATIEDIKVSGEMSATLKGDETQFKISLVSTETQHVDDETYTEWEWLVTPIKSGENPLKLVIKLKDLNKDIVVFNKNINITRNVPDAVGGFFEKYWQWLLTTIIIPVFLYFWNRKKKKSRLKS